MDQSLDFQSMQKDAGMEKPLEVTPEIVEIARLICGLGEPEEILSVLRSLAPAGVGH